jgi:hypothetical protein
MDGRLYHQLKKMENELQTKLTDVRRQLVELEWHTFLAQYIHTTAYTERIDDNDIEKQLSPSKNKG